MMLLLLTAGGEERGWVGGDLKEVSVQQQVELLAVLGGYDEHGLRPSEGSEARGWGRKIGRPPLDNSAKL